MTRANAWAAITVKKTTTRTTHPRYKTISGSASQTTFQRVATAAAKRLLKPDQLAESELFGHVEGAFTGADRTRLGSFEAAQHGTLFLDEISEMSRGLQAKLLRVLEAGEIQRLGSDQRQHVDVRVLAATNRDLRVEIDRKRFRADLFYRINVLHIHLPPLRERPEDIPPLVDFFVRQYRHESVSDVQGVAPQVLETLMEYHWPGNIRELRNVIHRACILCKTGVLQVGDIATRELSDRPAELGDFRDLSLAEMERRAIRHALRKHAGNKTAAARHLGVTSRTLHNKLNRDVELRKAS
ncbi:MAG: sigma 54-interacting transcriptional regulator [Planctomycetota bacterium]|nr:sigma 54-interacting transcriptional regulator [Planctomycetota bacterium]